MGPPYFTTFNYGYLFSNRDPSKSVNLTNENVIIDGYSLFYFIYYMIKREDKDKPITEQITTTKFAYDGLSEKFRSILKQFKDNCANVDVVFDGIFESNKHRRPDPKRDSTIQFNNSRSRLPPLLHDQLMSILHDLDIKVHIAPGEADPMIVQMARKRNAYIVARDSDYFLYGDTKGYVPLDTLAFPTLQGRYYYMQDVFQGMTQRGVALWATTIVYDFINLDVLQVITHSFIIK
jgi:5'-3' exonuclease